MGSEFFWLVIAVCCVPFFISGIRKKKRTRIILTGFPIVFCILIICNFKYREYMASSPQWVFLQAFGVFPNKDIIIEKSEYLFDSSEEEIVLKFKTNDINKILILRTDLKVISQVDFERQNSHQFPYWFKPLEKLPGKFYSASPGDRDDDPKVLLSYNPESGTVYFGYYSFD